MPVRYLSDTELARLNSWPADIADHDAVTSFTPTDDDRVRGSTLGLSAGLAALLVVVSLCTCSVSRRLVLVNECGPGRSVCLVWPAIKVRRPGAGVAQSGARW